MSGTHKSASDEQAARALESRVWDLMNAGDAKQAGMTCEKLNREYPTFAPGWHTTSHLMMRGGNPRAALAAIERALSLDPEVVTWQLQHGLCLARLGRFAKLAAVVEKLASKEMQSAYQHSALALLETQLGHRETALQRYLKAMELQPDDARHYYNAACLQRSLGSLEDAERNFDAAINRNPKDFESWKIRSDLRPQTVERNHIAALEKLIDGKIEDPKGSVQIHYALAKELEDTGEWQRSFATLKAGSDARRRLMQYDVSRDLDTIAAIKESFGATTFASAQPGSDNAEAIFILGLPRTGTTLVERIIASHTDVFAAGELNNFAAQLTVMMQEKNAGKRVSRDQMVASSAQLDFRRLGEAYVDSTRPFTGNTPRFIDKMPLNFLYVGLIHLALPNAAIINVERNPMDTCYAIYKQLFVDAYPYSYDLEELARYYVAYRDLMQHWNSVLPGIVHTVRYEDIVDDAESQSRQLIERCGIDWQDQCLRFYENREASTTASTAQVRRPIYKSSIGKWRRYEKELQPVLDILQQAGIDARG